MTDHLVPGVRQHDTHEELVEQVEPPVTPGSSPALGAIIVPASRPAEYLDQAITLAEDAGCQLVVLCSRQARADEVSELLASRSCAEPAVIDLPAGYRHRWLDFATSRPSKFGQLPKACTSRDSDLSIKRNLGLILARMLGWERIFFMDDDIRNVAVDDLRRTVSMLGPQYRSVGMRVNYYPDNSVVCHAHRMTGKFQDVLVSGSVLAVDCTAPLGFFPDVYNEDWLFFYHDAAEHRLAWSDVNATQLRYDPFDDPQRAARQEFGDVLAEGLYALLHRGRKAETATQDYWTNFLDARKGFLDAIIARAGRAPAEVRDKMLNSVRAARECSAQIQPEFCELYVRLWQKDLGRWQDTLAEIPQVSSVAKALSELGLATATSMMRRDDDRYGTTATMTPELASLNAIAVGEAEMTLHRVIEPLADATETDIIAPGVADAVGLGRRLAAATPPVMSFIALLAICLILPGDIAAWRAHHGWQRRAADRLNPLRQRSRKLITSGRDTARTLSSRIRRRPPQEPGGPGGPDGQQHVVMTQAGSRGRAPRRLSQVLPVRHIR